MTARIRLIFALILTTLIAGFGYVSSLPDALPEASRTSRTQTFEDLHSVDHIDALVNAITASSLFPNAQNREQLGIDEAGALSAEALERALADPNLSALVSTDGVWRIFLYAMGEDSVVREVGDELADGWVIELIGPTVVRLTKDNDQREIRVFELETTEE